MASLTLAEMMARHARPGRVEAILLRSERLAAPVFAERAHLNTDGFEGDHAPAGRRAVTLIQAEHLEVIARLAGLDSVDPAMLRRNVVVAGLNLLGFRKARLRLGQSIIQIIGPCPPCSRMEKALGHGGFTAMRGHGGVYAEVIEPGVVEVGDVVVLV